MAQVTIMLGTSVELEVSSPDEPDGNWLVKISTRDGEIEKFEIPARTAPSGQHLFTHVTANILLRIPQTLVGKFPYGEIEKSIAKLVMTPV